MTYQCTEAAKAKYPRNPVLAIERGVIVRIAVNLRIHSTEDGSARESGTIHVVSGIGQFGPK